MTADDPRDKVTDILLNGMPTTFDRAAAERLAQRIISSLDNHFLTIEEAAAERALTPRNLANALSKTGFPKPLRVIYRKEWEEWKASHPSRKRSGS